MKIRQSVLAEKERLIRYRRDLHRIPEEAFEEHKTSEYIWEVLEAMQPSRLERLCGTGIRAVFVPPECAQKTAVAVRADIDALPVTEPPGCGFESTHPGTMHACGHDGHMAMALGAAHLVSENLSSQTRPFVFIFQPAEETTGGADPMIREGALEDPHVDRIYGLHLWPYLKKGLIGLRPGALMASMCDLNVFIDGKSCHGARPQDGADTIVAGGHFITALQSILSRNLDPFETALVTVGRIEGGEARNVICASVQMEGTIRTFSEQARNLVRGRIGQMLDGLERMFNVTTRTEETMSYPPVINNAALCEEARSLFDAEDWTDPDPVMISEDFAFYQQKIPGLFAFVGTGEPGKDAPLHTPEFSFDENILLAGVEYFLRVTGSRVP